MAAPGQNAIMVDPKENAQRKLENAKKALTNLYAASKTGYPSIKSVTTLETAIKTAQKKYNEFTKPVAMSASAASAMTISPVPNPFAATAPAPAPAPAPVPIPAAAAAAAPPSPMLIPTHATGTVVVGAPLQKPLTPQQKLCKKYFPVYDFIHDFLKGFRSTDKEKANVKLLDPDNNSSKILQEYCYNFIKQYNSNCTSIAELNTNQKYKDIKSRIGPFVTSCLLENNFPGHRLVLTSVEVDLKDLIEDVYQLDEYCHIVTYDQIITPGFLDEVKEVKKYQNLKIVESTTSLNEVLADHDKRKRLADFYLHFLFTKEIVDKSTFKVSFVFDNGQNKIGQLFSDHAKARAVVIPQNIVDSASSTIAPFGSADAGKDLAVFFPSLSSATAPVQKDIYISPNNLLSPSYHIKYKNLGVSSKDPYGFTYHLKPTDIQQETTSRFASVGATRGPALNYLMYFLIKIIQKKPITPYPVNAVGIHIMKDIEAVPEVLTNIRNKTTDPTKPEMVLVDIKECGDADQITAATIVANMVGPLVFVSGDHVCSHNARSQRLHCITQLPNGKMFLYRSNATVQLTPEQIAAIKLKQKEEREAKQLLRDKQLLEHDRTMVVQYNEYITELFMYPHNETHIRNIEIFQKSILIVPPPFVPYKESSTLYEFSSLLHTIKKLDIFYYLDIIKNTIKKLSSLIQSPTTHQRPVNDIPIMNVNANRIKVTEARNIMDDWIYYTDTLKEQMTEISLDDIRTICTMLPLMPTFNAGEILTRVKGRIQSYSIFNYDAKDYVDLIAGFDVLMKDATSEHKYDFNTKIKVSYHMPLNKIINGMLYPNFKKILETLPFHIVIPPNKNQFLFLNIYPKLIAKAHSFTLHSPSLLDYLVRLIATFSPRVENNKIVIPKFTSLEVSQFISDAKNLNSIINMNNNANSPQVKKPKLQHQGGAGPLTNKDPNVALISFFRMCWFSNLCAQAAAIIQPILSAIQPLATIEIFKKEIQLANQQYGPDAANNIRESLKCFTKNMGNTKIPNTKDLYLAMKEILTTAVIEESIESAVYDVDISPITAEIDKILSEGLNNQTNMIRLFIVLTLCYDCINGFYKNGTSLCMELLKPIPFYIPLFHSSLTNKKDSFTLYKKYEIIFNHYITNTLNINPLAKIIFNINPNIQHMYTTPQKPKPTRITNMNTNIKRPNKRKFNTLNNRNKHKGKPNRKTIRQPRAYSPIPPWFYN
jgi:hypothetical protein